MQKYCIDHKIERIIESINSGNSGNFDEYREDIKGYILSFTGNSLKRYDAMLALEKVDKIYATNLYLSIISDKNSGLRRLASDRIGYSGNYKTGEDIYEYINDKDLTVANNILFSLIRLKYDLKEEDINNILNSKDVILRRRFFQLFDDPTFNKYIKYIRVALINDRDVIVRQMAATSLGKIGGDEAVKSLVLAFTDTDRTVRVVVVESLIEIGNMPALKALEEFLKIEKDDQLIEIAKCGLKRLNSDKDK